MIAHDGRAAHRIAEEDGHKNEVHVHDHTEHRHAVRAHQAHELPVIEHVDDGHGDIRHELRGAVAAGLGDGAQVEPRAAEPELALVGEDEVEQRNHAADILADGCGESRADHAEPQHRDEQRVEHDVRHARGDRDIQAEVRPLRRHEEALERVLQHEGDERDENDAPIAHAVGQECLVRAKQAGDGLKEQQAEHRENRAERDEQVHEQRERLVGFALIADAEHIRHECAAAGTEHEAHRAEDHQKWHDEVDCGEGIRADEVGDKNAVHHAVDGRKGHHDDGRERKAEQFAIGEVLRELDVHGFLPCAKYVRNRTIASIVRFRTTVKRKIRAAGLVLPHGADENRTAF